MTARTAGTQSQSLACVWVCVEASLTSAGPNETRIVAPSSSSSSHYSSLGKRGWWWRGGKSVSIRTYTLHTRLLLLLLLLISRARSSSRRRVLLGQGGLILPGF